MIRALVLLENRFEGIQSCGNVKQFEVEAVELMLFHFSAYASQEQQTQDVPGSPKRNGSDNAYAS